MMRKMYNILSSPAVLCPVSAWFLPRSGWWRSHLFPRLSPCFHCVVDEAVKETVSGQVTRWDKGNDSPQSVSPAAADKVRMRVKIFMMETSGTRLYLHPQNYCGEQLGFSRSQIISCPWHCKLQSVRHPSNFCCIGSGLMSKQSILNDSFNNENEGTIWTFSSTLKVHQSDNCRPVVVLMNCAKIGGELLTMN